MKIHGSSSSTFVLYSVIFWISHQHKTALGWSVPRSKADLPSKRGIFRKGVRDQSQSSPLDMTENSDVVDIPTVGQKRKYRLPDLDTLIKSSTSGLAVSLAMVPEAISFAFVAGVSPLVGLWTTVVLGFTAAALGGRAGICSSASGACSVVVAALCASHGPAYLSACAMMAGILQILGGYLGVGKLIKLVSSPCMMGFVNGLALVMTKAQLVHFQSASGTFLSPTSSLGSATYGIAALTMMLVKVLPKITKKVPPTLGAVTLASLFAKVFSIPAKTLADVAGASTFTGGLSVLPKIGLPNIPFTLESFKVVLPYAIVMASVGVLESLLTMQLLDNLADDGTKGSTRQECLGQGTGNLFSGLTGGIGGCALLGQSIINMESGGGVSRWSGMSMSIFLALGIVAGAPLLANVPVASLVGVMLLVCYGTFSWSSLRLINKIPKLDAAVIALVSIVTVQKDLAVAIVAGVIASSLGFAYKQSHSITALISEQSNDQQKIYQLKGPLFFGSTRTFDSLFTPKEDPPSIVLNISECQLMDQSAVNSLEALTRKYNDMGKSVYIEGISVDGDRMLQRYIEGLRKPPFESVSSTVINGITSPRYQAISTA